MIRTASPRPSRRSRRMPAEKVRADMVPRYGIVTDNALGVPMATMQAVAEDARPRPRARRRPLGHRRLRGAHGRRA